MARIEWVKHRLNNWALWRVQEASGGMGFASQSSFLNDAPGDSLRESKIPIDEIDASITNEAVESLKLPRPHLYRTLQCIYPLGLGVQGAARQCGCQPSNIHALLGVADAVLAVWFRERAEKQEALRKARQGSFTT